MSRGVFRSVAAVAVAVSSVLTTAAAPAVAAPPGLTRWPGGVITVSDQTRDPLVAVAVKEWDGLGVVRISETPSPCQTGQACITVVHVPLNPALGGWTTTHTSAGVIRDATVEINTLPSLSRSWALNVRVHELGHALGLVHAPGSVSSVMAPVVDGRTAPTGWDAAVLGVAYSR